MFKFCPCVVVYLHYFNWKLPFFNPQNLPNPTKPTLRFTFHSLSSIFFDTLKSPPSTVYIHLFRAERPLTFLASTSAPAASSTRQISAWPSLAARAARSTRCRPSRPRRRAPSAAGAGSPRGDRARPPGRCRCRLGGPRAAPGPRWQGGRGHNGDPKKSWKHVECFVSFFESTTKCIDVY